MKKALFFLLAYFATTHVMAADDVILFPANGATDVCPDTRLTITFPEEVTLGNKGMIRVFDCETGRLVDQLDMSIPPGPTESQPRNPDAVYTPVPYQYLSQNITNRNTKAGTPSGAAQKDRSIGKYQLSIIGGFSDGFHFYPVMIHGRQANIQLHHNLLEYGHRYAVTIDRGVFNGFDGIRSKRLWTFTTKTAPPPAQQKFFTVAADGTGDFATVQGAMDFIPDFLGSEQERVTVQVMNGDYEELVYFRNKRFVTILGESKEGVRIHYPNNEVFNPHPWDIKTNELKGTFPSRRAAFAADNCEHLVLKNLTIQTDCHGQAEGLLINGEYNYIDNVHIIGSGDALQTNGSAYYNNCTIDGEGDTVLGRGPTYFNHCTLTSWGAFMWIRNTEENHGNVFIDCTFIGKGKDAVITRLPDNKGKNYPHAEVVMLNCKLENIPSVGWGPIDPSANSATLLEFNSHDLNGNPIDVSQRHPVSRQLNPIQDAKTIADYYNSNFVLGW